MADFSKQWAEIFDPEFPWDFEFAVFICNPKLVVVICD